MSVRWRDTVLRTLFLVEAAVAVVSVVLLNMTLDPICLTPTAISLVGMWLVAGDIREDG